jgi:hypothetical protein
MSGIIVPGREYTMKMSLAAFKKIAEFVLKNPIKSGDHFTIEGTDKKKLVIVLEA